MASTSSRRFIKLLLRRFLGVNENLVCVHLLVDASPIGVVDLLALIVVWDVLLDYKWLLFKDHDSVVFDVILFLVVRRRFLPILLCEQVPGEESLFEIRRSDTARHILPHLLLFHQGSNLLSFQLFALVFCLGAPVLKIFLFFLLCKSLKTSLFPCFNDNLSKHLVIIVHLVSRLDQLLDLSMRQVRQLSHRAHFLLHLLNHISCFGRRSQLLFYRFHHFLHLSN